MPTPAEIRLRPDVAILDALNAVLDVAIVAVVAANPELWPTKSGRDGVHSQEGEAADQVILAAQALAAAIDLYRAMVIGDQVGRPAEGRGR